eukprot:TRINITY_DN21477_c0_g1_i2.p1 TRINITY_DN21477_c0_g1~~TRINITY_DN21477_c0_g1_i2.p1  ORF type:complete len:393 (-),score=67.93 TRINITY_DN21477_c0_g1_i2:191-1369(-)
MLRSLVGSEMCIRDRSPARSRAAAAEASAGRNTGLQTWVKGHGANSPIEDTWIVKEDERHIFLAIFDGHGGSPVAEYCRERCYGLFQKWFEATREPAMALMQSLMEADTSWLCDVRQRIHHDPNQSGIFRRVVCGSCAIVAVLDKKHQVLYVGNLGDSRSVIGTIPRDSGVLESVPMSRDHAASAGLERLRIRIEHPDDQVITEQWDEVVNEYAWFVKNRARFTRSVGDACMKDLQSSALYNERVPDAFPKVLPLPQKPYISNKPEVFSRRVTSGDKFVVMASDGLWDEMSSDQAVHTVQGLIELHGRDENIADKLLQFCLVKIVRRLHVEEPDLQINSVEDLVAFPPGGYGRRGLHDDITIIIMIYDPTARDPRASPTCITHRAEMPKPHH